jgi:hypothetical protein
MTRTLVTYSGAGGGWSTAAGVAPHSALHFLSPGCQLRVRRPRSGPCGITDFVGNEAYREINRAETVVRRRVNVQVSRHHRCQRGREPTTGTSTITTNSRRSA